MFSVDRTPTALATATKSYSTLHFRQCKQGSATKNNKNRYSELNPFRLGRIFVKNHYTPEQVHQKIQLRKRVANGVTQSAIRIDSPEAAMLSDDPEDTHKHGRHRRSNAIFKKCTSLYTQNCNQKLCGYKNAQGKRTHKFKYRDFGKLVGDEEQPKDETAQKGAPISKNVPLRRGKSAQAEKQKDYRRDRKIKQRGFREYKYTAHKRSEDAHAHRADSSTCQVLFGLDRPEAECARNHPKETAKDAYRQKAERVRRKRNAKLPDEHAQGHAGEVRPRRELGPGLERDHICAERKDGKNETNVTISQCRTPQIFVVKRLQTRFRPLCSGANGAPAAFQKPKVPPPDSCG